MRHRKASRTRDDQTVERRPSNVESSPEPDLVSRGSGWAGAFRAMASPCEVLLDTDDARLARRVVDAVAIEARRVEAKYSRYRDDNIVAALNAATGRPVALDPETVRLVDFSARVHALSDGLFDVTSGALREVWRFDGTGSVPDEAAIAAVLGRIGFERLVRAEGALTVPPGMQVDFGGIAKEYAVDRAVGIAAALARRDASGGSAPAALVNFGGDLAVSGPPRAGAWTIGLERDGGPGASDESESMRLPTLELERGALATSGTRYRSITVGGVRHGHVLDPRSGRPVSGAPTSVTVAGERCTDAGVLSTLALLHGDEAERFLDVSGARYWCQR